MKLYQDTTCGCFVASSSSSPPSSALQVRDSSSTTMYVVTLEKSPFLLLFNEVQNHLEFLGSNMKMDGPMSTEIRLNFRRQGRAK